MTQQKSAGKQLIKLQQPVTQALMKAITGVQKERLLYTYRRQKKLVPPLNVLTKLLLNTKMR